jgi:hypothetical protein
MRPAFRRVLFGLTPCPQASAFLLRTDGLTARERTAYVRLINGLVKDGLWGKLDALYIFATNTTATADLNLISTSFGLSQIGGALTFAADRGYTGVSARALSTGLVLTAATKFTLNSGCIGGYVLTNRTANSNLTLGGVTDASRYVYMKVHNGSGLAEFDVNSTTFSTVATTTAQGSWFLNRSAASGAGAQTLYLNGASLSATAVATVAVPVTQPVYIGALNNNGLVNTASTDEISAFWVGGGFNAADVASFSSRLNAYMTALGINVH